MKKQKRAKHNYTSELELKSLLIRINNKLLHKRKSGINFDEQNTTRNIMLNNKINKYIIQFNKINNKKYPQDEIKRKNIIKYKIKAKVIELSEETIIDTSSYENFGKIILLMIQKILTKPNFSGYTYKDEMYSDAIGKILKYLHNFNHKLISELTGQMVNSFAYISQIIHNAIIYVINTKKKENEKIKNQISLEITNNGLNIPDYDKTMISSYYHDEVMDSIQEIEKHHIDMSDIKTTLVDYLRNLINLGIEHKTIFFYPKEYRINMEEYNELRPLLKENISIMRSHD